MHFSSPLHIPRLPHPPRLVTLVNIGLEVQNVKLIITKFLHPHAFSSVLGLYVFLVTLFRTSSAYICPII